jgi:hypothetical protein
VAVGPVHHGGDGDATVHHIDSVDLSALWSGVPATGPTGSRLCFRAGVALILMDMDGPLIRSLRFPQQAVKPLSQLVVRLEIPGSL